MSSTEPSTSTPRDHGGFWLSMAVLGVFGLMIAFGFGVAYLLV